MKRVLPTVILLSFCIFGNSQTTYTASGTNATQNSSGNLAWTIDASNACESIDDNEASLSGETLSLLRSSHTLLIEDFIFSSFPASESVSDAQLLIEFEQVSTVNVLLDLTIRVIRINGGETTLLNYTGSELLNAIGIFPLTIDGDSGWSLSGLTGDDLNNSSFRVEIEIEIPLSIAFEFGVDQVEIAFTSSTALPVKWDDFKVTRSKEGVHLKWTTEVESNNAFFSLEKSSNGKNWQVFQELRGAGTSFKRKEYEVMDRWPFVPICYYRIKQVDFDDKYEYSEIVSISGHTASFSPIVVNPVIENFVIQYSSNHVDSNLEVRLLDHFGREVYRTFVSKENNTFFVNALTSGSYFLAMKDNITQQKWIKPVIYISN
ncbi:MAG: T9SS type A sorting domain-containing protein [Saprospiraceae bacterium]